MVIFMSNSSYEEVNSEELFCAKNRQILYINKFLF